MSKIRERIYGNNVNLFPVTEKDLDFICEIEADPNLWVYEESVEEDKTKIREKFESRINDKYFYDFIICRAKDGKPVGVANIWSYIEQRKSWEIGYGILPQFQNQGFCKEAVKLLLSFAFDKLNAHKVVGMCNAKNIYSVAIMDAVGMHKEGVFREELLWKGDWVDQLFFSILDKEYNKL